MYKDMTQILKEGKVGNFELSHFEIKKDDIYAMVHGIPSGKFIRLTNSGGMMMFLHTNRFLSITQFIWIFGIISMKKSTKKK